MGSVTACLLAVWDPLGPQTANRMDAHDIVCLHTMAGSFAGTDSMFHRDGYGGTESHFGVSGAGRVKQWQDLDYRADANFEGNRRVISIETADVAEGFPDWYPDGPVPPWNDAQLDAIVKLVGWLCDRYGIPKRLVADSQPGRRGIAYHRQGIDGNYPPPYLGRQGVGERWSTSTGKVCPGDARIRQLIEIVIPRVQGDDMPLNATDLANVEKTVEKTVRRVLNEGTGRGQPNWAETSQAQLAQAQTNGRAIATVGAAVGRLDDVDEVALAKEIVAVLPVDTLAAAIAERVPVEDHAALLDALAARLAG